MSETLQSPGQPFTFSGVARYASARFGRLLGVALLFALLPGAVLGRVAAHCWWPVISEAVGTLPESGRIDNGELHIQERDARLLAANQFLSLQLTFGDLSPESVPVDIAIDFGRYELRASSLLGEIIFTYPEFWTLALDRSTCWSLWGAWKGPILAGLISGSIVFLIGTWFALALLYAPFVLTIAGIAGRPVKFAGAWKMSVAAQWPASLLMTFALALYSTGEIGLLFVIIMFAAHFLPTLINVLVSPFFLTKGAPAESRGEPEREKKVKPTRASREKENPFTPGKRSRSSKNPFGPTNSGD